MRCLAGVAVLLGFAVLAWGCYQVERGIGAPQRTQAHPGLQMVSLGDPLEGSEQVVLVVADDWTSSKGELAFFERGREDGAPWKMISGPYPVSLSKDGLAWGRGLHVRKPGWGAVKTGQAASPAGVFNLVSAFGVQPAEQVRKNGVKMGYAQMGKDDVCITDPASGLFNTLLNCGLACPILCDMSNSVSLYQDSFAWGIVVGHNTSGTDMRSGGCVFLHLEAGGRGSVSGGTAMPAEAMESLLSGLDPNSDPVLVQLPRKEYELLREPWSLPSL